MAEQQVVKAPDRVSGCAMKQSERRKRKPRTKANGAKESPEPKRTAQKKAPNQSERRKRKPRTKNGTGLFAV